MDDEDVVAVVADFSKCRVGDVVVDDLSTAATALVVYDVDDDDMRPESDSYVTNETTNLKLCCCAEHMFISLAVHNSG